MAYVGGPQLHDATVMRVDILGKVLEVLVKSETGDMLKISFFGVESMNSNRSEGMIIYALAEIKAEGPVRHFVFVNWDEKDDAALEVKAADFRMAKA
jgi:hypothetical protein